ncbi:uncharacterized protein LOC129757867 isoform X1 [Uranotaenia lowii]|uniref:uncharacterized protein LOC129757867 isoform X1 n=1 Tax=Uranotaenia lowii TaxID=190385 RepID=UPI0024786644|nr:uncharacterized protein LOC129757867 isoform X1 [Uranotaenia lowii]
MHIRWLLFVATVVVVCCFTSASGPGEELAVGQPDFSNNSTQTLHGRRKRYIIFREISRGFARANVKDRMIDITNIWAHAYGFRWNVEYNNPPGLMITKRDLHESIGELIQAHGFDGRACILRTFCEMSKVMTPKSGFMLKLFRKIFTDVQQRQHNLMERRNDAFMAPSFDMAKAPVQSLIEKVKSCWLMEATKKGGENLNPLLCILPPKLHFPAKVAVNGPAVIAGKHPEWFR